MPGGDPKGLTAQFVNKIAGGATDAAAGDVLQFVLGADTVSAQVLSTGNDRGKVPAIIVNAVEFGTIPPDGEGAGVVQGIVMAKVDGDAVDVAVGDLLNVANGSKKLTKWVNAAGLAEPAALITAPPGIAVQPNDNLAIVARPATVTNIAVATAFASTLSVDANTLAAGDYIDVYAQGVCTAQNGTDAHTIQLRFAGDVAISSTAIDIAPGDMWALRARIQIRTVGATGTWVAGGSAYIGTRGVVPAATDLPVHDFLGSTIDDFTGALVLDVLVTHGAASAGNQSDMDIFQAQIVRSGSTTGLQALANDLRSEIVKIQADLAALRTNILAIAEYARVVRGVALEAVTTDSTGKVAIINNPLVQS